MGLARIELATSSLSAMRSNRLSYRPWQRIRILRTIAITTKSPGQGAYRHLQRGVDKHPLALLCAVGHSEADAAYKISDAVVNHHGQRRHDGGKHHADQAQQAGG